MNKNQNKQKSPLPCGGGLGVGKTQNIKQGYRQSEIGILPQDWEVVRLGEVCEFLKTYQNARSDLNDNDEINYIHYGEIHTKYEHFIDFAKAKLPKINAKKLAKELQSITFCQNGDLVVVDASEDYTAIAKSVEIQNLDSRAVAGLHTFLLRDKANYFANGFKGYMLYNSEVYSELKRLATGISVLSVSKANLSNLQIPLPPLKEQEKIARILSAWDNAIATLDSLIKAKQRYKKALMQRLLTPPIIYADSDSFESSPSLAEGDKGGGSLRGFEKAETIHKGVESTHPLAPSAREGEQKANTPTPSLRFGVFSDKWQEFRLGDICKVKKGEQLNKLSLSDEANGKFAVINGGILPSGYTDKFNAKENTITISEGGNSCGFVNLIRDKFWSGGHCYTILDSKADTFYLYYFLKFKEKFIQELRVGSGLPNIQKKDIEKFKVFLPTLAEQKKIAQVLSMCDKEIETLNLKLQCLKTQKRGLMQQLLSGNVRVKI